MRKMVQHFAIAKHHQHHRQNVNENVTVSGDREDGRGKHGEGGHPPPTDGTVEYLHHPPASCTLSDSRLTDVVAVCFGVTFHPHLIARLSDYAITTSPNTDTTQLVMICV